MPKYKDYGERAATYIKKQPQNDKTVIHQILERDISGWKQKDIAVDVGLSTTRVSIIQRSPMYDGMRKDRLAALHEKVAEKVSEHIVDAEIVLKKAKLEAAHTMIDIMRTGRSEAVRAGVAERIVDRGKDKSGVNVIVQINEKLADRMDKVLRYNE